jgi:hypothetical protein
MSSRVPGGASSAGARGAVLLAVAVVLGIVLLQAFDTGDPVGQAVTSGDSNDTVPTTIGANSGTVAPATTTTLVTRPPAEVKVLVANGTAIRGLGGKTSDALKALTYNVLSPTDTTKALETSSIQYDTGFETEARAIATTLGLPVSAVVPLNSPPVDDARGASVIVLLGADVGQTTTTTTA